GTICGANVRKKTHNNSPPSPASIPFDVHYITNCYSFGVCHTPFRVFHEWSSHVNCICFNTIKIFLVVLVSRCKTLFYPSQRNLTKEQNSIIMSPQKTRRNILSRFRRMSSKINTIPKNPTSLNQNRRFKDCKLSLFT